MDNCITHEVKEKVNGSSSEWTRSNSSNSGMIYLKCILGKHISGTKYSVTNIKEKLRKMKISDFNHDVPKSILFVK